MNLTAMNRRNVRNETAFASIFASEPVAATAQPVAKVAAGRGGILIPALTLAAVAALVLVAALS